MRWPVYADAKGRCNAPIRDLLASFVQLHNMEMTPACQRRAGPLTMRAGPAGEGPWSGYSSVRSKVSVPSFLPSVAVTAPVKWPLTIFPASVNLRSIFGLMLV